MDWAGSINSMRNEMHRLKSDATWSESEIARLKDELKSLNARYTYRVDETVRLQRENDKLLEFVKEIADFEEYYHQIGVNGGAHYIAKATQLLAELEGK
jgi:chromosome segregation ATPase